MLWMLPFACAPEIECLEGHTPADDGHCYPASSAPAWLADVQSLPCQRTDPADTLRIEGPCLAGACIDDPHEVLLANLGPPDACFESSFRGRTLCTWEERDLLASITDPEQDFQFRPEDRVLQLRTLDGAATATPDGLGIGATLGCAVVDLGAPSRVELRTGDVDAAPRRLTYDALGLAFDDLDADGLIDSVQLFAGTR